MTMAGFSKLSLGEFLSLLASPAPTPGGGTAAAAAGAMGAGLAEMVAALTLAREKYAAVHDAMREISRDASAARERFQSLASEDSEAYERVVAARRLPKDTEAEAAHRAAELADANRRATEVPLATARLAAGLLERLPELAEKGNPNAASDAGSAALLLDAAAQGALLNVAINLPGLADAGEASEIATEAIRLKEDASRLSATTLQAVRARI